MIGTHQLSTIDRKSRGVKGDEIQVQHMRFRKVEASYISSRYKTPGIPASKRFVFV